MLDTIKKIIDVYVCTETDKTDIYLSSEERKCFVNDSYSIAFIPLRKKLSELCTKLMSHYITEKDYDSLSFDTTDPDTTCRFSAYLLSPVLKLISTYYSWVDVSTKHDSPMIIKTEDFKMLIAPRADDD